MRKTHALVGVAMAILEDPTDRLAGGVLRGRLRDVLLDRLLNRNRRWG